MAKTFEEWWEQTGDSYSLTVADDEDSCEAAWHARDAELSEKDARIAELESRLAAEEEKSSGLRQARTILIAEREKLQRELAAATESEKPIEAAAYERGKRDAAEECDGAQRDKWEGKFLSSEGAQKWNRWVTELGDAILALKDRGAKGDGE